MHSVTWYSSASPALLSYAFAFSYTKGGASVMLMTKPASAASRAASSGYLCNQAEIRRRQVGA